MDIDWYLAEMAWIVSYIRPNAVKLHTCFKWITQNSGNCWHLLFAESLCEENENTEYEGEVAYAAVISRGEG